MKSLPRLPYIHRMCMVLADPTYTVYDRKLDEISAQTTAYTPYVYGSGRP
jgi:hypothetical protein